MKIEEKKEKELVFDPSFLTFDDDKKPDDDKANINELNLLENTNSLDEEKDDSVINKSQKDQEEIKNDDNTQLPNETDDNKGSSVFSVVLGQELTEAGVLSDFDEKEVLKIAEEENDAAAIKYMIQKQTESINEEVKSAYDSEYQEYLNLRQFGASKEEATELTQIENYVGSLKDTDIKGEDEGIAETRKNLLTLNYRLTTKWSEDKIKKHVDRLYDAGEDIEEVDEAVENINSYVSSEKENIKLQAQKAEADAKASQEKIVNDLESYIEKTDEYFTGIKVNKQTKDNLKKIIMTPVKLNNGQLGNPIWAKREESPVEFDTKMAYLYSIGYFDGKPLDKFKKVADTKATSKLQEMIQDNQGRSFKGSMNRSFNKSNASNDPFDVL